MSDGVRAVLSVRKVTAGYGGAPVLREVDVEAHRGQITAIVGLNGSGKSTLVKCIAGSLKQSQGEVLLDGENVLGLPPESLIRRGISYVPQVANVFQSMTVRENLEMGGLVLKSGVREKIAEVTDLFPDLKPAMKAAARTLSGGQRHMLAVARGLMVNPRALLLDEPTTGLAPQLCEALWDRIRDIRNTGVALVVVDQNVKRALSEADWGYVLAFGRNSKDGAAKDLLSAEEMGDLYTFMSGGTIAS